MHSSTTRLVAVWMTLLMASTVSCQSRGAGSMTESKRIISTETLREMTKADSDNAIPRSSSCAANTAIVKKLKNDFRSLQQINNALMAYIWGTNKLDFQKLSEMIADINRKAIRLKKNLSLPEPETKAESAAHPNISNLKELRENLLVMDKAIADFVNSPLLRKPDVISKDSAQQTSATLSRVISLSGLIGKASAHLKN